MIVQEGILISVFFAALLSLIIADRIHKSQLAIQAATWRTKKDNRPIEVVTTVRATTYDYALRHDTNLSLPAMFLLVLGIFNYIFSYSFVGGYNEY